MTSMVEGNKKKSRGRPRKLVLVKNDRLDGNVIEQNQSSCQDILIKKLDITAVTFKMNIGEKISIYDLGYESIKNIVSIQNEVTSLIPAIYYGCDVTMTLYVTTKSNVYKSFVLCIGVAIFHKNDTDVKHSILEQKIINLSVLDLADIFDNNDVTLSVCRYKKINVHEKDVIDSIELKLEYISEHEKRQGDSPSTKYVLLLKRSRKQTLQSLLS